MGKQITILGIESSCDETAAAIVVNGTKIISNTVASSVDIHAKSGGIIPENAARQQIKSIIPVIKQTLDTFSEQYNDNKSNDQIVVSAPEDNSYSSLGDNNVIKNIDAIAVTYGPGLIGSLLVGVETAKTLSYVWDKPLIPVNHLVAHIYANFITEDKENKINDQSPKFPALALVVSGGHTDLVLMNDHGNIKWIGGTRDDAAGEAFDKCARLLGLPYPGGPAISKKADEILSHKNNLNLDMFPRPIINEDNYDWSFSGLKTSVLRKVNDADNIENNLPEYSAQIQEAIVDVLVEKSLRAIKEFQPKSFLLSGGVAANNRLKETFQQRISEENISVDYFAPKPKLSTDNAAVIASAAYFNYSPVPWSDVNADPQLSIVDNV